MRRGDLFANGIYGSASARIYVAYPYGCAPPPACENSKGGNRGRSTAELSKPPEVAEAKIFSVLKVVFCSCSVGSPVILSKLISLYGN